MKLSEQAEEALELLWLKTEEGTSKSVPIKSLESEDQAMLAKEMVRQELVTIEGDNIRMTDNGRMEARSIVRRHRLAERLLTDVFDTDHEIIEDRACHFEHFLHEGIDDNICILLGHPKVCPHGKPIPPGDCCREFRAEAGQVVISLPELDTGQKGEIAYVQTINSSNLQKLMSTGVLPGMDITLLQKFPSYVFQIGETQIAVDREIARDIFVRIRNAPNNRHKKKHRRGRMFKS